MNKRILFLTYGEQLPSFRHRVAARVPALQKAGWQCTTAVLPSRNYIARIAALRSDLRLSDVVVLSKLKLNSVECWLLKRWCKRIIFDVDDSIWLRRPKGVGEPPGQSLWRNLKFNAVCRVADTVIVGNAVLADRVRAVNANILLVPTTVDVEAYRAEEISRDFKRFTAVWVGLPGNLVFLEFIRPALAAVARDFPQFSLRIVSSRSVEWDDVPIEFVEWSSTAEITALRSADVGLMPLFDDEWSRGKCAFKLLQYMAAGLPCIASPVGANTEAVIPEENGFLASSVGEWEAALRSLIDDPLTCAKFGEASSQRVEEFYDRGIADKAWRTLLGEGSAVNSHANE